MIYEFRKRTCGLVFNKTKTVYDLPASFQQRKLFKKNCLTTGSVKFIRKLIRKDESKYHQTGY